MNERDFDKNPYSKDEKRVAQFFFDRGVGGGDDPIEALIAGYQYLVHERNELRAHLTDDAQAVPAPVAWRLTDGEGDYEYLTEEPSDQSRAWSRRYGREWEPLYASPVSSSPSEPAQLMWQPFETAPKDGTWIIARCNDHSRMFRISWGRAQNGDMCWCTSESIISYGDGLFSPNGGWTPCPISQLPSTQLCCPAGCMFTPCRSSQPSPAERGGAA